jgi:hypothetical protein
LLQLASQAMGKVAIHVDDIELEDFYDMIPDHCRRWVLSQHMIQILLKDVPLSALLPGLADICIDAGAEEQVIVFNKAFQLLCGFWLRRNKFRREDYQWAIKKMKSICRSSAWASFLSMYLMDNGPSVRLYQSIDSPDFSLEVAFKVICGYIEIETKDLSALEETISFLVKYSFDYNTTNSRFRDCINLLLSNPFSSLERLKSEVMFNFGLLVVSLLSEDRELKSIFALLNQSLTKTMVYDAVSQYAWNSSQLYQTGCLAQTNGYPDLAINVFICAVNLAREEQETEVLNFVPDLESRILDLQANHKPQTSWYCSIT